ncbi:MAG: hypothetical protein WC334_11210, partial [Kiritimatiellales bacterium]
MYDIQFERASGKRFLSRFALLFPPFELGGVASGGAGGEFEVEEGVEKAAVMHHSLGIFRRHFKEARLSAHDFGDMVRNGFWNADTVELADVAVGGFLQ